MNTCTDEEAHLGKTHIMYLYAYSVSVVCMVIGIGSVVPLACPKLSGVPEDPRQAHGELLQRLRHQHGQQPRQQPAGNNNSNDSRNTDNNNMISGDHTNY